MSSAPLEDAAIVNVASIVAKTGFACYSAYAASKAGVVAFTKSLAQELAGTNVRVNVVLPGVTESRTTSLIPSPWKPILVPMVPLRRVARADEIAEVIKFLCSPASSYITGTAFEVAGGLFA